MNKLLLFLILASAFLIRVPGLHWGVPTKSGTLASYQPDEPNVFLGLANMARNRSLDAGREGLLSGALYFYLSAIFLGLAKAVGYVQFGSREFLLANLWAADRLYIAIRLFSVLTVLAAAGLLYLLVRKLYGSASGLWAAFALAFSPIVVAVSLYTKVDGLFLLTLILMAWAFLNLLESDSPRDLMLAGASAGLVASTRYTGGLYIALLPFILWKKDPSRAVRNTCAACAAAFTAFAVTTPYAVLDLKLFLKTFFFQFHNFAASASVPVPPQPNGFWDYLSYFVPFSLGWPVWLVSLAGLGAAVLRGSVKERFVAGGLALGFSFLALADARWAYYIVLYLPFVLILFARGMKMLEENLPRWPFRVIAAGILLYQFSYGWAFARLYSLPNPRELAERWLADDAREGASVGILRSFYWTPGVLRRADSPYRVVSADEGSRQTWEAAANLGKMEKADYFVTSELELGPFLRQPDFFAGQASAIGSFLSGYDEAASFVLRPRLLGFSFWKRKPPDDMLFPAPTITIYKKKAG
ncbi:MAG: hypothetical protein A2902_01595 [Elusimicrobia bacterium RIFCSPLOWO2_01_FULL_64_13]|nr:MAG: hypothetical protein A2902_01595 [Elusimicrobia bacterium RIFCSPLOWO2_01_FULL_64_13]